MATVLIQRMQDIGSQKGRRPLNTTLSKCSVSARLVLPKHPRITSFLYYLIYICLILVLNSPSSLVSSKEAEAICSIHCGQP